MNRRYTDEMKDWMRERYPSHSGTLAEIAAEFEEHFGLTMSRSKIRDLAHRLGLERDRQYIRYTPEMDDFLRSFIPGHTWQEIARAFEERFGHPMTKRIVENNKRRLGVLSGTIGGRFEKGRPSPRKGKTWDEMGVSPEAQARSRTTCFKKGNEPHNGRKIPLGAERVSEDGYIQVKVSRFRRARVNDGWRMKHHIVWEEANGRPVPPSTMIVFADGDKRNFDPDNLVAVPRSIWSVIARQNIPYCDRQSLEAAMSLAKLRGGIYAATQRVKESRRPR